LYNSTTDKNGLIEEDVEEDKRYIYWSVDLDSLNLPEQFCMTFTVRENFFKDGQLCDLTDNGDLVGNPPPNIQ
jgi:hypothetical protein